MRWWRSRRTWAPSNRNGNDRTISRGLRGGADLRLRPPAGREGTDQGLRRRIRSAALPPRRRSRARLDIPRASGERLAHRRADHAAPGRERLEARGRNRRRGLRRIPLAAARAAGRRALRRERNTRSAAVEVPPGAGIDQGADDDEESERRAGAGVRRESCRTAAAHIEVSRASQNRKTRRQGLSLARRCNCPSYSARTVSIVSASFALLSSRSRLTRAKRSAKPPG